MMQPDINPLHEYPIRNNLMTEDAPKQLAVEKIFDLRAR
jgi:hypothetical protein